MIQFSNNHIHLNKVKGETHLTTLNFITHMCDAEAIYSKLCIILTSVVEHSGCYKIGCCIFGIIYGDRHNDAVS